MNNVPQEHPEFITITCLEWRPVLADDRFKDIVLDSVRFLVRNERIYIYAFVIMPNHFHMIWQMKGEHKRQDVQRDFLRFTSQQILKHLRNENASILKGLWVKAKDRKYQIWERNSLGVPLWTPAVFEQKLNYIHRNPVKAGLCEKPNDYWYSSSRFYETNKSDWDFLTHYGG